MKEQLEAIIFHLVRPDRQQQVALLDPVQQWDETASEPTAIARSLNAAFLITLAGPQHPAFESASHFISRLATVADWAEVARFYQAGIAQIHSEIETVCQQNPDFASRLVALAQWLSQPENHNNAEAVSEKTWSVFFPEGLGIRAAQAAQVEALRAKRTVTLTDLAAEPLAEPWRQVLFTSNVLLTLLPASKSLDELPFSADLKETLRQSSQEPQLYWYDHPIQIGVEFEKNEILYGLRALDAALDVERSRGNLPEGAKVACALSVSVTHQSLQKIGKKYLEEELTSSGGLKNLDIYAFSEADTQHLIDQVLAPAAQHYLQRDDAAEQLAVFGVDGEYGRHYSFLKAILALWNLFVQPEVKATFKIDLDQVFPQQALVEQSGASALEHFKTPLWGARGVDSDGQAVELGMLAGALVNERDIAKSLFFPDVLFPNRPLAPDEYVFFSTLPQALSTETEMMTRYDGGQWDGQRQCLQRIHVTGGTNGILVDSLRRYRPFTPSFIGRAEDQAYIFSTFPQSGTQLAYAHEPGLIMRHDKEAFAQEAIQAAYVGKLIGDYVRLLYFSNYTRVLSDNIASVKDKVNPFTGCFISEIPATVTYLRFGLKAASFFVAGKEQQGLEFVSIGSKRIHQALEFVTGEESALKSQYVQEREGWNLYYEILDALEAALNQGESFAQELSQKVKAIVNQCAVHFS